MQDREQMLRRYRELFRRHEWCIPGRDEDALSDEERQELNELYRALFEDLQKRIDQARKGA